VGLETNHRSIDSATQATLIHKIQAGQEFLPIMIALMVHAWKHLTYAHTLDLYRERLNETFNERTNLQFYANGCCRFDGWQTNRKSYDKLKGQECLDYCAKHDNCLAAEMASENGQSQCVLFQGSGHNFRTECGQGLVSQKCYTKEKVAKVPLRFYGQGCCRFDDWRATDQGRTTQNSCTDVCASDPQCIATEVAKPDKDDKYDCYTYYGIGNNFHTECGVSDKTQRCFRKSTMTLTIGQSSSNKQCVTEGTADCDADAGNRGNRINPDNSGAKDRFRITKENGKICAQRLDESHGWGMNLQLQCDIP